MSETNTQTYVLTDLAGPVVAGRRVGSAREIELTPTEAEYELREGTIVAKGKNPSKAFDKGSKALDRARDEAEAAKARALAGAGLGTSNPSTAPGATGSTGTGAATTTGTAAASGAAATPAGKGDASKGA